MMDGHYCVWLATGLVVDVRADLKTQAEVDELIRVLETIGKVLPADAAATD